MLSRLKTIFQSSGTSGPRPSGVCLWHDLQDLNALAQELAEETVAAARGDVEKGSVDRC